MNKKVLVIAVALMAVALLATPVMAASPEKIQLTLFGGFGSYSPPDVWVSGNVQHGRGATGTFPTWIVWGEVFPPWPPALGTYLMGSGLWIADYNVNLANGNGVLHYTVEITLVDGTFEGNIILHGEFTRFGPNQEYASQVNGFRYGVLHGTGVYQGWKLVISGPTIDGDFEGEIYLFKPVT